MRDNYSSLEGIQALEELIRWAKDVARTRRFDLEDYDNQISGNPFIFDVPSSSSDMIGTEKVGDIAADDSFFYVVVDNAGVLEWRRVGISSF